MPRLLLRPGWILTHLAVVAIAVTFVNLGLWQLDRHAERQADNVRITAAQQRDPAPLDEALAAPDLYLQPASVEGTFDGADVRLGPRSRNQLPGFEVLTPLRLTDGRVLLVNRGWVPLDDPIPAPPAGSVALVGRLQEPSTARQVLPAGADVVELVSSPDLSVLEGQVPDLIDVAYFEVVDEVARGAGVVPRPAEPVVLDGGNHLSYAMQWFAFTAIGLTGYPLLLRRRIVEEHGAEADEDPREAVPAAHGRGGTHRVSQ